MTRASGARLVIFVAAAAAVAGCARREPAPAMPEPPPLWSAEGRLAPVAEATRTSASPDALLATPVTAFIDAGLLRTHPVGARIGPLVAALRGWADIEKRAGRALDPVTDADWLLVRGDRAASTVEDPVLARIRGGEDAVSRMFGPALGPAEDLPLGVVRVGPRTVLAPRGGGGDAARRVVDERVVEGARGPEALWVVVRDPGAQAGLGGAALWAGTARVRLAGEGAPDGGAELAMDAVCADAASADGLAERLGGVVVRLNTAVTRLVLRGLLDGVRFEAEGHHVRSRIHASRAQLVALVNMAAAASGSAMQPLSWP